MDALEDLVALLTESVDRNFSGDISSDEDVVALLTESVDRNKAFNAQRLVALGRSPHGERG